MVPPSRKMSLVRNSVGAAKPSQTQQSRAQQGPLHLAGRPWIGQQTGMSPSEVGSKALAGPPGGDCGPESTLGPHVLGSSSINA